MLGLVRVIVGINNFPLWYLISFTNQLSHHISYHTDITLVGKSRGFNAVKDINCWLLACVTEVFPLVK